MKEEDDSTDYSYSNLAYDNADMSGPPTFWNTSQEQKYQSDDSLFNINFNFDATDDEVFQIDSLNLLGMTDSPQSEQSFFEDEEATTNPNELKSERTKNKPVEKKENPLEHGLLVPEIPNLVSLSDGNLLKLDRNITNTDTIKAKPKSKPLELHPSRIVQIESVIDQREKPVIAKAVTGPKPTADVACAVASELEKLPSANPRCAQCNKKLGIIMVMKCHCEKIFCAKHRYAEAHNCSFDFRKEGQKTIAKENPLVVASKVTKI